MFKRLIIAVGLLVSLGLYAQESQVTAVTSENATSSKTQSGSKIFTGFSGGMMFHVGYAFSQSPDELFRNASLKDVTNIGNLPSDGVALGLGGQLRCHLINHIHLGAEGGMSMMPLMKSGSNIRIGWGAIMCDFYANWGKVRPLIGLSVGGGSMRRLYVPSSGETVQKEGSDETVYNSSYTKTPFFLIDPYVGMEIGLGTRMALLIRIDYMLPFGTNGSVLSAPNVSWSNFVSPSGPRLYVGILFGKMG